MIKKKAIKTYNYIRNIAIILACGESKRFKLNSPKQYTELFNNIILNHTIKIFLKNKEIDKILLVLNKKHKKYFDKILVDRKIFFTYGGDSRQKSVFYGLKFIKKFNPRNILVHDASRPFTETNLISQILRQLKRYKVVIPRIQIQDTIKKINNNRITPIDRNKMFIIQTPQGFNFKDLFDKHRSLNNKNFTDDSSLFDSSSKVIKYIRNKIKFKNLLISDDISMKSLKFSISENTKKAFKAGCDLVLHCNARYSEMIEVAKNSPKVNAFITKKTSQFYKILS